MLIRWAAEDDKAQWLALSREYDKYIGKLSSDLAQWYEGFDEYMDSKIRKNNALIAIDRMSGRCIGAAAFSKTNNRITFFAVSEGDESSETADRLLTTALRQLDTAKDIGVMLPVGICDVFLLIIAAFIKHGFAITGDAVMEGGVKAHKLIRHSVNEKRGGSFHYDYDNYLLMSKKDNCPACNGLPMPEGHIDIAEMKYSFSTAEYPGQGRLFGKMHMLAKMHVVDFEEMPPDEMAGFMREVQTTARALHKVTGAVKINFEIHANSGPHIHIHLFPRYLDDDFPSAPIDYRIAEPAPYKNMEEYLWFVKRMKDELNISP